jgi:hypothetical protein
MSTDDDDAALPERERARSEPSPIRELRPEELRREESRQEELRREERRERRIDDDDGLPETLRQRLESLVPELVKKTFAAGMGAVFSTEEGIRKIAREVSLPDVVGYVASSADGAKDKVFEIVARETRDFLANLNLTEEIAKLLTTLSFEIKTEIRFIPNSERLIGSEPDVKASVRLKRTDRPEETDELRDSRSRRRFWRRDDDGTGDPGDDDNDDSGGHDK